MQQAEHAMSESNYFANSPCLSCIEIQPIPLVTQAPPDASYSSITSRTPSPYILNIYNETNSTSPSLP